MKANPIMGEGVKGAIIEFNVEELRELHELKETLSALTVDHPEYRRGKENTTDVETQKLDCTRSWMKRITSRELVILIDNVFATTNLLTKIAKDVKPRSQTHEELYGFSPKRLTKPEEERRNIMK